MDTRDRSKAVGARALFSSSLNSSWLGHPVTAGDLGLLHPFVQRGW